MLKEGTRAGLAIQSLHSTSQFRRAPLQKKKGTREANACLVPLLDEIESGERVMPANRRHSLSRNGSECPFLGRLIRTHRGRIRTLAGVIGHIPVSDLADKLIRQLPNECSACAQTVNSRSVPLNVDLAISLGGSNVANAAMGRKVSPAAGYRNSAAAEAEVASHSIDEHHIAGIAVILQAEAERAHREAAGGCVA
jgi:hypothetical protein